MKKKELHKTGEEQMKEKELHKTGGEQMKEKGLHKTGGEQMKKKGLHKTGCTVIWMIAALVLVLLGIRHLQRGDLSYEMASRVGTYLEDVRVQILGKCEDTYYFLVDSSNFDKLSAQELQDLYKEVNLERMYVIFISNGKRYYLIPEGERMQVKFLPQDEEAG